MSKQANLIQYKSGEIHVVAPVGAQRKARFQVYLPGLSFQGMVLRETFLSLAQAEECIDATLARRARADVRIQKLTAVGKARHPLAFKTGPITEAELDCAMRDIEMNAA